MRKVVLSEQKLARRPHLFRGTDWLSPQNWNDPYRNTTGQIVPGFSLSPGTANLARAHSEGLQSFWAPEFNQYFTDDALPPKRPCAVSGILAITWESPFTVALCELSFTQSTHLPWGEEDHQLHSNGAPSPKSGGTLYHELFHTVLGTGNNTASE